MEPWHESSFEIGEISTRAEKVIAEQRATVRGKSSGAGLPWRY
jgi:hypothetical protein